MVHLVYCDDKEKVLEKILDGSKTMIIRGAAGRKIPHSRVFEGEKIYFIKKGTAKISTPWRGCRNIAKDKKVFLMYSKYGVPQDILSGNYI